MAKKKKKRIKLKILTMFILLIIIGIVILYQLSPKVYKSKSDTLEKLKVLETKYAYYDCMRSGYQSEDLNKKFNELKSKYPNISIYFNDLSNNYIYSQNETKIYYSASVVKLFDAIYLIEKAKVGEIDLDDTITYLPSDNRSGSLKTSKHKYNDKIRLRDLIDYAISVSDNAAHFMLVKHIGASNLNKYFKTEHNINLNITDAKPFAYNYTAKMANASLELVYDIIDADDEYSKLLKNAMNNTYVNGLNFDDKEFLHKYGLFAANYHDLGINATNFPYLISILTPYGETDYITKVSKIHKEIYQIYEENINAKLEYCSKLK